MNPNPAGPTGSAPNPAGPIDPTAWEGAQAILRGARNVTKAAAYATGRGIRNYALPALRNHAYPVFRNRVLPAIQSCVGSFCRRTRRRVGNAATRVLARLDWVNNFDNGLAITPRDRAVVQGIIARETSEGDPNIIANYIARLVENVAGRISDLITDTNADPTAEYFRSLAEREFSADLKSLYMLHLASMGRFGEIEQPSVSTAAHILAQANYLPVAEMVYDNVDDGEFLQALQAIQTRRVGGRRKSRKSRKLRKSRKSHKHGRR